MSATKPPASPLKSRAISKTISLPDDLCKEVEELRIKPDPELDWSKHVRSLVRADLELAKQEAKLKVAA